MGLKILFRGFLIVIFLFKSNAYSQDMFVGANTYVYVKNQYVFVKNSLELYAASNFYLREGGQLLQGTTVGGSNRGIGNLSVFQEGTANNYHYNYWCSPVGNVKSATVGNNSFGISQLGSPKNSVDSTPAVILPLSADDGMAYPLSIAPSWIYKFIAKGSYSDWVSVGGDTTLNPGEGFTMKGTSGIDVTKVDGVQNNPGGQQRYDFRGKPNDGTITIPVAAGQITLTGNPYPSAIDLQAFLTKETNCTGIAYFWEEDQTVNSHYLEDYKGGYGTYSPGGDADGIYVPAVFYSYDGSGKQVAEIGSSGKAVERKYSPIGQGFLIEGKENGIVQMKNEYRVFKQESKGNHSEFAKVKGIAKTATMRAGERVIPQIRFNTLIDNGPVSQMVVAFDPSSTNNADHAMDALSQNDGPANNYFVIDNKEFIINVMPFAADAAIPIGFRNSAQANYKITVNEISNFPEGTNVYLHNKSTDLYYDIKNSFYEVTLAPGVYNSQYEITFVDKNSLGIKDINGSRKSFFVSQDNANKEVRIKNPLRLGLASCSLYDVAGKIVFTKVKLETEDTYTFSTSGLASGVYIVKIVTADKTESGTKIIISN